MVSGLAPSARFRHVVFPDSVGGYGRALDVARVPARGAGPWAAAGAEAASSGPGQVQPVSGRPESEAPLAEDEECFVTGLFARAGLSLRHYKPETFRRRLPACLRALRANSLDHARSILQRNNNLDAAAIDSLLVGVTAFFRDRPVFDALRKKVLPCLLSERDLRRRPLRVWSAGCSDGAELYSVAILLAETGAFAGWGCQLLGTDCRPDAVARAAAGAFEPDRVAGVPEGLLDLHFTFDGSHYRVHDRLRAAARWRTADVLNDDAGFPEPFDLVLCRNLAIYLQPGATATLWSSLVRGLRAGGVLVTGKAERPLGTRDLVVEGPCVYRKGPRRS